MSKLHEVLAVETALEKTARKLCEESKKTFSKDNLFKGAVKRLEMFNEGDKHLENTEYLKLTTTVDENLEYLVKPIAKYWDTVLSKDSANQEATADVVLEDGTVLAEALPATFLLGMETKLAKLRSVYEAIPTLAPGVKWIPDNNEGAGVFMNAHDNTTFKTKKDLEFRIAYEATAEHPAQVRDIENTVNVGKYVTTSQCSMLRPLDKAERISRLDAVLLAVKQARMRANAYKVDTSIRVGEKLLGFINSGT